MTYRWVDSQVEFEALIDRLVTEPRYALDTEFHRERTYFPKLALMQFAVDSETTLVDPLAVDLGALRRACERYGLPWGPPATGLPKPPPPEL